MDRVAGCRTAGSRRRGLTLMMAAITAALTMAAASSAQAAPNVAKAWGLNRTGQLGDGTNTGPEKCEAETEACSTTPVEVNELSGVTAVAAGFGHSLALLEGGTVRAWGANGSGQLGDGTNTGSDVPVPVKGLSGVTAVAAGFGHSLALLSNGTVMAWGDNGSGQLGDGTNTGSDVPIAVSELKEVTAIAAGGSHSLALLSNGTVMAWGANGSGQLGDGTNTGSDVPIAVSELKEVTAVAAGRNYSLALLANGTLMAWGENTFGDLGNGTTTNSSVPVKVDNLSGVSRISAAADHALALLNDGTVMAWGENKYGELGNGASTGPEKCGILMNIACSRTPIAVSGLSGVGAVSAGDVHSLALLRNGAVMAWGQNSVGQLGNGSSLGPEPCGSASCSTTPVAVKQAGAVIKGIAAGAKHSLAFGPKPPPANLPEIGRCVKVTAPNGTYSDGACTKLATGELGKKYVWIPVSQTEKQTFSGSGLATTLTTAGHSTIKCITADFSGEWTGPKTASVTVILEGCTNAQNQQCQTILNQGNTKAEIALFAVEGELGFIKYEEVEGKLLLAVGLDLRPHPVPPGARREFGTYECTGSSEKGHIEGSVIGKITPIDKMTTTSNLLYLARSNGEQKPESFQGSPPDTLFTTFTSGLEEAVTGSGASSLNVKEYKGSNAAPLEIKAK
jgi:alpha-tubulin suppressor-like RCC1 family protein